jgi:hypothetical protein
MKISAEKVLSQALAIVPLPAAIWELEQIGARLDDAQKLIEQNEFSNQVNEADAQEALVWHLETFQGLVERLETAGATEEAIQLRSLLKEQLLHTSNLKTIDTLMKQELPSAVRSLFDGLALPVQSTVITPAAGDNSEKEEKLFVVPATPVSIPAPVQVPVLETAPSAAGQPAIQSGEKVVPSISVSVPSDSKEEGEEPDDPVKDVVDVVEDIEEKLPKLPLPLGL